MCRLTSGHALRSRATGLVESLKFVTSTSLQLVCQPLCKHRVNDAGFKCRKSALPWSVNRATVRGFDRKTHRAGIGP